MEFPLTRVHEDVVGGAEFLEALLRVWRGVHIGVAKLRLAQVCLLDLIRRGLRVDAKFVERAVFSRAHPRGHAAPEWR